MLNYHTKLALRKATVTILYAAGSILTIAAGISFGAPLVIASGIAFLFGTLTNYFGRPE